jgi:hypothetical protein
MSNRCFVLLLFFSLLSGSSTAVAASPKGGFEELKQILLECQGAYHRLVDYRGTLRKEVVQDGFLRGQEVIEVLFRKPSYLLLRWQTGVYEGTRLLVRPDRNQSDLLIKLGGWFEYVAVKVLPTEVGEPFVPGLKDISEWLTALASLAQRLPLDPSLRLVEVQTGGPNVAEGQVLLSVPSFLIPFRDNNVAVYDFVIERGTGIPIELVLRGAGGAVRQRLTYTDLQVNVGVPVQAFSWEEQSGGEAALPQADAALDLRRFIQHWQHRYGEVVDYTGVWTVEEYWRDQEKRSEVVFKFRKPFDVYLRWVGPAGGRREALFRRGWNGGKVRVRTTLWGIPIIGDLHPEGYWAQLGSRYPITEFGLNQLVERLQTQLLQAWLQGNLTVRFLGVLPHEQRPCYVLEFTFPAVQRDYTPARTVTYWDIARRLPVKYEAYGRDGQLLERHAYFQLQLNVSLGDGDFDAANPAYGFLLFRHAPRIDRFLTGRE